MHINNSWRAPTPQYTSIRRTLKPICSRVAICLRLATNLFATRPKTVHFVFCKMHASHYTFTCHAPKNCTLCFLSPAWRLLYACLSLHIYSPHAQKLYNLFSVACMTFAACLSLTTHLFATRPKLYSLFSVACNICICCMKFAACLPLTTRLFATRPKNVHFVLYRMQHLHLLHEFCCMPVLSSVSYARHAHV